jgi:hypothetical protein
MVAASWKNRKEQAMGLDMYLTGKKFVMDASLALLYSYRGSFAPIA